MALSTARNWPHAASLIGNSPSIVTDLPPTIGTGMVSTLPLTPPVRRCCCPGGRHEAQGHHVALPVWRVQARVNLDQGRPAASADPVRDRPVEGALPSADQC